MTNRTKIINVEKRYLISSTTTKAAAQREAISRRVRGERATIIKFGKKEAIYEHANYGIYA